MICWLCELTQVRATRCITVVSGTLAYKLQKVADFLKVLCSFSKLRAAGSCVYRKPTRRKKLIFERSERTPVRLALCSVGLCLEQAPCFKCHTVLTFWLCEPRAPLNNILRIRRILFFLAVALFFPTTIALKVSRYSLNQTFIRKCATCYSFFVVFAFRCTQLLIPLTLCWLREPIAPLNNIPRIRRILFFSAVVLFYIHNCLRHAVFQNCTKLYTQVCHLLHITLYEERSLTSEKSINSEDDDPL